MAAKKDRKQESDFPLEALRIDYTDMSQDEFIVACGFKRATYLRWSSGKTSLKPTLDQVVAVCRVCKISLDTFFRRLGLDISGIPDG